MICKFRSGIVSFVSARQLSVLQVRFCLHHVFFAQPLWTIVALLSRQQRPSGKGSVGCASYLYFFLLRIAVFSRTELGLDFSAFQFLAFSLGFFPAMCIVLLQVQSACTCCLSACGTCWRFGLGAAFKTKIDGGKVVGQAGWIDWRGGPPNNTPTQQVHESCRHSTASRCRHSGPKIQQDQGCAGTLASQAAVVTKFWGCSGDLAANLG